MKKHTLTKTALFAAAAALLSGCNGVGAKDSLLARFNDENVYKEDLTMLEMNSGKKDRWDMQVYESLYSKAAVASDAKKEFPEIEKDWEAYLKDVDVRILTNVFQRFFVDECMMYPDSELRRFFDANKRLFQSDSAGESVEYVKVRSEVAGEYFVYKNKEKFAEYLSGDSTNGGDTLASKRRFIENQRNELRGSITANLLERNNYKIMPLPPVDAKAYYENHKDEYKTVPGYVLYHVQMADSAALASLFAENVTLEQFKAVAAKSSKNNLTAKDGGYVGFVKHNYPLPAGIGSVDGLGDVLTGKPVGFVTPVLRSTDGAFQRFFLAEHVESKVKPFDRVEASIKAEAASGALLEVDSNFAVITKDGKTVFTQGDLNRFNKKYFGNRKLTAKSHDRIARIIAETFAYADMAIENKLDHSWEYRALTRSSRWDYIYERYLDKKLYSGPVSEDTLKSMFETMKKVNPSDRSFESVKGELEKIAMFPKNVYNHEYLFGYRMIYKGSTFEESRLKIYYQRLENVRFYLGKRYSYESYAKASSHFYGDDVPQYVPNESVDFLAARADSLYKNGKPLDAYYVYRDIMFSYPENDSLFQFATYLMAQTQSDAESYDDAEAEYYAFYRMWPQNENAEKAMFSRGFVLSENLGNDSTALEVFREFMDKYPNSELKESADWLVKNIESKGKLAEELLQKIKDQE
ncbi:MAG: peptidyl-prolyl cis-trans isomerase [Fibrobacter sp.]|nr:peptidyl-prolyl cis-trans isomerase [Fibrobacter sp.]